MAFIDIRGIERASEMRTCTLNQFRQWLGFSRTLYNGKIDDVELYPGPAFTPKVAKLTASPTRRLSTAKHDARLAVTASLRLASPTADTRTSEENYTEWGHADVQRVQKDQANKAYGGQSHKLLFRALKDHFPQNSVYSWFPTTLPEAMEEALGRLGPNLKDCRDFKNLETERHTVEIREVSTYELSLEIAQCCYISENFAMVMTRTSPDATRTRGRTCNCQVELSSVSCHSQSLPRAAQNY
ncbi:hypothetical protein B0H19DRAFT_1069368 [Mycena capillaripes]|nr:hypothetical protein B0H19DRAFT_1069368 [Mycena capillaripes]